MKPACMSDDEYSGWEQANERILNRESRADSPCRDCTATFHWEIRAAGSCDGTPGPKPRPTLDLLPPDELRALRRQYPYHGAPSELSRALDRARWREYRRGLRARVVAG